MKPRSSPRRDFSGDLTSTISSYSTSADTPRTRRSSFTSRPGTQVPGSASFSSSGLHSTCRVLGREKSPLMTPQADSGEKQSSASWRLPDSYGAGLAGLGPHWRCAMAVRLAHANLGNNILDSPEEKAYLL